MTVHLLYFRLGGVKRFADIHGAEVARAALADVTRRVGSLGRAILRQHAVLSAPASPEAGVWAIPFRLKRLEIAADEREQLDSIAAAGRELARAALAAELGTAVALHAGLEVGTLAVGEGAGPARRLRALRDFLRRAPGAPLAASAAERAAVKAVIGRPLEIRLQRIVTLGTGRTAAFEALLRGPAGGPLRGPERLLAQAARCGLREELELAALEAALSLARRLPASLRLAVNLSPGLFSSPIVRRIADEPGLPERLIFEITEHLPVRSPSRLNASLDRLRRRGAKIALDDAGCGYLNMELIRVLRPDIVKLCITVTRRIGAGPEVLSLVHATVDAIRAAGASALAEGVETHEQARLALVCGCSLAQGWHFGRPRAAAAAIAEASSPRRQ
jgi:EAL domain-containing protein (putative c-di-GMP-specific phosphodiesterase class I)